MNPLNDRDFEELQPGARSEGRLNHLLGWWKPAPGEYWIRLTYDSTGPYLQSWAGTTSTVSRRSRELLALVPKGRFTSNAVKVTVTP